MLATIQPNSRMNTVSNADKTRHMQVNATYFYKPQTINQTDTEERHTSLLLSPCNLRRNTMPAVNQRR